MPGYSLGPQWSPGGEKTNNCRDGAQ